MERLERTAKEVKRKYLSTYFGVLYLPLFLGVVIGTYLGIFIQTEYQEEEINQLHEEYKKEKKRDQFIIDSIQYNELTYKMPLDRNGYPVEEMIKRESNE